MNKNVAGLAAGAVLAIGLTACAQMGQASLARARREFDERTTTDQLLSRYSELLREAGRG